VGGEVAGGGVGGGGGGGGGGAPRIRCCWCTGMCRVSESCEYLVCVGCQSVCKVSKLIFDTLHTLDTRVYLLCVSSVCRVSKIVRILPHSIVYEFSHPTHLYVSHRLCAIVQQERDI